MDTYDPKQVFSSIDEFGRYAFANQPRIGLWNLTRFAECLLPLLDDDKDMAIKQAEAALDGFAEQFTAAHQAGLRRKLGLSTEREGDQQLAQALFDAMTAGQADFTLTFRRLSDAAGDGDDSKVRALFQDPAGFDEWAPRWRQRLAEERQTPAERQAAMHSVNPAFIPRNHRIEAVIAAAVRENDFAPFEELIAVLAKPYENQPAYAAYAEPPQPEERVLQTFCGT